MGAFEFDSNTNLTARNCGCSSNAGSGEVCIIAQKILDQCRIQKCLTPDILGPARAVTNPVPCCNEMFCEGDIIVPPCNATDVIMKHLRLKKIEIIRKTPSPLQSGCWDIELKYIFEYTLEFRRADGCFIGCIDATSSYTLKLTLFGGTETDITVVNDMFTGNNISSSEPYCIAEGKALALAAELKYANRNCTTNCYCCCDCCCDCGPSNGCHGDMSMDAPIAVNVTIGLFTIVQLYRTVNMLVESAGRCLPEPCVSPLSPAGDPCANFDAMSFPWDLFSPNEVPKSCCAVGPNYSSPNCELDDNSCGNNSCNCNNSCGTNNCNCNNSCGCNNRCGCR